MPSSVKVNGTDNSLVHKGSGGSSKCTVPDICKTPTPGGPVPMPYQNMAQSVMLASGSTTVKADGMMIAIKGSEFSLSNGDEAGTIGGVKSNTFIKEATWILYSFDVKMDGANACRLSDKMFHNHENTVNASGEDQAKKKVRPVMDCGEAGAYKDLQKKTGKGSRLAAKLRKKFTEQMASTISALADTIAIPKPLHQGHSATYGGRSDPETDADDLNKAAKRDLKEIEDNWGQHDPDCAEAYTAAADDIRKKIKDDPDYYEKWLTGIIKGTIK
jgi:uncharacterized Zn-binding protein involved in type VI secretion